MCCKKYIIRRLRFDFSVQIDKLFRTSVNLVKSPKNAHMHITCAPTLSQKTKYVDVKRTPHGVSSPNCRLYNSFEMERYLMIEM